ncbi:MAG: hypothetical protein ACR2NN_23145 [Bryobacteraceae bacterium]
METDLIDKKRQACRLIDRLAPDQLAAVVNLLEVMTVHPVSRKLALEHFLIEE